MSKAPDSFIFVHSNRRVICAWEGLTQLAELAAQAKARRPVVVMDAFFQGGTIAARVAELLRSATRAEAVFHYVPLQEPDTGSIEACHAAMSGETPDLIVAVGGGSTMDTAKISRLMLANPGPVQDMAGLAKRLNPHASLLVAVPTTAGTGSEVSESAIAGLAGSNVKLIFRSQEMTPQIALLDASLSTSAPPQVTAGSGYDAVTHAVEAYVSKAASMMTDPFAESAMHLLGRWLPVAYREPNDARARTACLVASCQAAIAFNSANLGLAHAIAAPLGALHHVPHGLANALALPAVTAFNEPAMGDKAQAIAAAFGGTTAAQALARLRAEVGLNIGLDEFVPSEEAREELARAAMKSGQVRMNPRPATLDDMRTILQDMRTPFDGQAMLRR